MKHSDSEFSCQSKRPLPVSGEVGFEKRIQEPSLEKVDSATPRLVWINDGPARKSTPANTPDFAEKESFILVDGNPALKALADVSSLLMLQGPIGPLFTRIASWKRSLGHKVRRVVFNAGDSVYCGDKDAIHFRHGHADWSKHLRNYIRRYSIDGVLLFGQTRYYHREAVRVCQLMGVAVFVMEEGYVRPGFLTLEMTGVNALSSTLQNYDLSPDAMSRDLRPSPVIWHQLKLSLHAMFYYLCLKIGARRYPNYLHHRHDSLWRYAKYWVIASLMYPITRLQDRKTLEKLDTGKPYFFVPLQIDSDAQIRFHSPYNGIGSFLDEVLQSFASHAPETAQLVIKQHPLARGHIFERQRILKRAAEMGIADRVFFVHVCKIYKLLKTVAGVVTVNSTVGIQAIGHAAPLKIMGEAMYNHSDVADTQPLDSFWRNPFRPDPARAKDFHLKLKLLTQVPAALYEMPNVRLAWNVLLHYKPDHKL